MQPHNTVFLEWILEQCNDQDALVATNNAMETPLEMIFRWHHWQVKKVGYSKVEAYVIDFLTTIASNLPYFSGTVRELQDYPTSDGSLLDTAFLAFDTPPCTLLRWFLDQGVDDDGYRHYLEYVARRELEKEKQIREQLEQQQQR